MNKLIEAEIKNFTSIDIEAEMTKCLEYEIDAEIFLKFNRLWTRPNVGGDYGFNNEY